MIESFVWGNKSEIQKLHSWWVSVYRPGSEATDVKQTLWSLQGEKLLKKPRTKDEPDVCVVNSLTTCVYSFSRPSPEQNRLSECEEQAKAAKKGMWSEGNGSHTLRDLKYTIENPRHFVDSHHQKPVNGEAVGKRRMWLRVIPLCLLLSFWRFIKPILL